jgi:hypothetical protein
MSVLLQREDRGVVVLRLRPWDRCTQSHDILPKDIQLKASGTVRPANNLRTAVLRLGISS